MLMTFLPKLVAFLFQLGAEVSQLFGRQRGFGQGILVHRGGMHGANTDEKQQVITTAPTEGFPPGSG